MDLPIFNLKHLRLSFYYFLFASLFVFFAGLLIVMLMDAEILLSYSEKIDSMYLFGIIFLVNFLTNKASNKELNKISETQNFDEKFKLYELFFQKKLIWNFISILLSTLFWISFQKNLFLYIILIQLILTPLFYPRKKLISKELNREDIVFT